MPVFSRIILCWLNENDDQWQQSHFPSITSNDSLKIMLSKCKYFLRFIFFWLNFIIDGSGIVDKMGKMTIDRSNVATT